MNYKELRRPLTHKEVEFRIQSINTAGYATILVYKDARIDMDRLDDVCGANNWKREHSNGNANCTVSIWDGDKSQWISKEDTGTESNTEKAKGLASDSFKRACFNWGIGRELYEYPNIQIKLNPDEYEVKEINTPQGKKQKAFAKYQLRLNEWVWYSEFTDGKLSYLAAKDVSGAKRYSFGKIKEVKK
jgi:hypothetical protein